MGKYSLAWTNQATTTGLTTRAALGTNAAAESGEVVEILVTGSAAAPQDYQHHAEGSVLTMGATGVSTTTAPTAMTGGIQPASNLHAGLTHTTEPTAYVAVPVVSFGFNQRGGMRWAVPQGEGIRLIGVTGTTNSGLGVRISSSTAGNVDGHIHHWEA